MSGQLIQKNSGFTIVEIAVVLALAGAILAVIFLAVPTLQKSQRDDHRKRDVALTLIAVKEYMAGHYGIVPPASGNTPTGQVFDINGDGIIDEEESRALWTTGNHSVALAPYLGEVIGSAVTTTISVYDATRVSGLHVAIGHEDIEGLITVFLGAKCPVERPRPNVMTMRLTKNKHDISIFRYLERGEIYCEDLG